MTEIHEYNMALRSVGREAEAIPVSVVFNFLFLVLILLWHRFRCLPLFRWERE